MRFALDRFIHGETAHVLRALPEPVRRDLMDDPTFVLCDYDPTTGEGVCVPMSIPAVNGCSRSVVLKRTLARRPRPFVHWLIAHELAHAHLRNAGRWPEEDPEHAADALAADWGFPRPPRG
ncbi:MAG: hypothetical protein WDZ31_12395 [Phycisphaeraceae bacterium]